MINKNKKLYITYIGIFIIVVCLYLSYNRNNSIEKFNVNKRNLMYACVFHNKDYIKLLKLLIQSISLKANINKDTTDILIITSPTFLPIIQTELSEYDLPLKYMTLKLNTKMEASCCKLNIYDYENVDLYKRILYLDTDILINSDINILFNLNISSNKIYTLEEGTIGEKDVYGSQFFDFTKFNKNTAAFTAGVFYFINSEQIKKLLDDVRTHIDTFIYKDKSINTRYIRSTISSL